MNMFASVDEIMPIIASEVVHHLRLHSTVGGSINEALHHRAPHRVHHKIHQLFQQAMEDTNKLLSRGCTLNGHYHRTGVLHMGGHLRHCRNWNERPDDQR